MNTRQERIAQLRAQFAARYTALLNHPDGYEIYFDRKAHRLEVYEGEDVEISVPFGPDGLIEMGMKLVALGHELNIGEQR
jgi:hypothetical protein